MLTVRGGAQKQEGEKKKQNKQKKLFPQFLLLLLLLFDERLGDCLLPLRFGDDCAALMYLGGE